MREKTHLEEKFVALNSGLKIPFFSYPFQFFSLSLVCPLLSKVLLCIDKAVIDDEVDVRVVGVKELDNVSQVGVVQK